jgi:methionine synthase II (cobalamin-independent)
VLVEKRNFTEFAGEFTRDYFGKCHEAGLRVGRHGEAASERSSAVGSADPGTEDKGVATVEGDGWLDIDGSRRVRHVISGEISYMERQLSVF